METDDGLDLKKAISKLVKETGFFKNLEEDDDDEEDLPELDLESFHIESERCFLDLYKSVNALRSLCQELISTLSDQRE